MMRIHGIGVDISKPQNKGGIDFDFGKPPCCFRLQGFMIKQYNAGNLHKKAYRPLMQAPERFEDACNRVLSSIMKWNTLEWCVNSPYCGVFVVESKRSKSAQRTHALTKCVKIHMSSKQINTHDIKSIDMFCWAIYLTHEPRKRI